MNEPQKPSDLIIYEDMDSLKNSIINIVQNARLPLSVIKLILQSTTNELVSVIDKTLEAERNKYYTALSEYQTQVSQEQKVKKDTK